MNMSSKAEIKLQTLLRMTIAINKNSPSSELIELFASSLLNCFCIDKIIFFSYKDNQWHLRYPKSPSVDLNIFRPYQSLKSEFKPDGYDKLHEMGISYVLPVYHKDTPLGIFFFGWHEPVSESEMEFIKTFSNVLVMAIENKRLAKAELKRNAMNREISLASDIQKKLLPDSFPYEDHLKVCGFYLPFHEVGGDYYDWIPLNKHEYLFCIADVSGKGIPAALLMSNIQACLRSLVGFTHNLKDIIIEINKRIWHGVRGEQYASMFLGKINLRSQQLTSINAGHCFPLMYENGKIRTLDKGCTLLGISDELNNIDVELTEYAGEIGLLMFTDGLTELIADNENFPKDFCENLLLKYYNNPRELVHHIQQEVFHYSNEYELKDDVAVMSIFVNDLFF